MVSEAPIGDPELDEEYASSEDSDFAPDAAPAEVESESEASDNEMHATAGTRPKKPSKRKRTDDDAEDLGFENSGDEAIIEKARKKRKKKGSNETAEEDEDEGGEGGFVKTRAMKAAAIEEKKPLVDTSTATVDVDALWAEMINGGGLPKRPTVTDVTEVDAASTGGKADPGADTQTESRSLPAQEEQPETITIERTYTFAGKTHNEKKTVPRESAEAKLYLASKTSKPNVQLTEDNGPKLRRAPKARRSIFEPVLEFLPQRTDLRFKVSSYVPRAVKPGKDSAAKKLNTIEKSALDWAGYVDKEGIKDELELAGRAKGTYLSNQDFLARAESKREEEARAARLKERGI